MMTAIVGAVVMSIVLAALYKIFEPSVLMKNNRHRGSLAAHARLRKEDGCSGSKQSSAQNQEQGG